MLQRLGQGGLEVCSGRSASTDYGTGDTWTPVEPCQDAITINIGDLLMRWSVTLSHTHTPLSLPFGSTRPPSPAVYCKECLPVHTPLVRRSNT